jgi:hypothetical protein
LILISDGSFGTSIAEKARGPFQRARKELQ